MKDFEYAYRLFDTAQRQVLTPGLFRRATLAEQRLGEIDC